MADEDDIRGLDNSPINNYAEPASPHGYALVLRVDQRMHTHPGRPIMKLYKDSTYSVAALVEDITKGKVALPDIQRPFVWSAAQVRNLFDSMYRGYPVGYLLFWETGVAAGSRQIGAGADLEAPANLIIDGQQRSTALYAVMTAKPVMRKDYTTARITIAFRPTDGTFEVGNAAVQQNPEFLKDISRLFSPEISAGSVKREYLRRLRTHRHVDEAEEDRIEEAIEQLRDLAKYEFRVVVLSANADVEEISEIFVRINSAGSELNKSDFLLTLMSVFWEQGRRELETFCAASRSPAVDGKPSPFNWHLHPKPVQMLRASIALAFKRARLESVYALLRGRDVDNMENRAERVEAQFATLAMAQKSVLDLVNWHEFLQCLELAGFRGKKMISSDNAVIYSYAMWLIGRTEYKVPIQRLRHLIARWFFMGHTTSRYSGAFESTVERDLAQISAVATDADSFCAALEEKIEDHLTGDYWNVTLPNELGTSAGKSPALSAYIAALNILDAQALLSPVKVRTRLDPSIISRKGIERHHLFPKAYLEKSLDITDRRQTNHIANMALVDWSDNISISDRAPAEYWPEQCRANGLDGEELAAQEYWHALPADWTTLPYSDFLRQRQRLMAQVVRDGYAKLAAVSYQAQYPAPQAPTPQPAALELIGLPDLVEAGMLSPGDVLVNGEDDTEALVTETGQIDFEDVLYESPTAAATAASGGKTNGLSYWSVEVPEGGMRTLQQLTKESLRRWDDIDPDLLADPAAAPLLQGMSVAGAPVPQFGVDQVDGWEAELAWPSRKVAVLSGVDNDADRRLAAFTAAGWHAKTAGKWTIVDLIHALTQ
ncbi:hypothetical protein GCM10023223_44160 [Stackebrandtia albiflava]